MMPSAMVQHVKDHDVIRISRPSSRIHMPRRDEMRLGVQEHPISAQAASWAQEMGCFFSKPW